VRVLIAIALASGCYNPSIDDCQFTCGPGMDCPDGSDCVNGVCRTTKGTCMNVTMDSSGICPAGTPAIPSTCSNPFKTSFGCGIHCGTDGGGSERQWSSAIQSCSQIGWQLAILDSKEDLDAISGSASNREWVGARRTPTITGDWRWLNNVVIGQVLFLGGVYPVAGDDCAFATGTPRRLENTLSCGSTERFLCTFPLQ
jgi:hypothetical protein